MHETLFRFRTTRFFFSVDSSLREREFQERTVDVHLEFNLMVQHGENQHMNSNQLKNYSEEERDGDRQYDSVDKDQEVNVEKLQPLHQVETNE
jgi:hypothetical protein